MGTGPAWELALLGTWKNRYIFWSVCALQYDGYDSLHKLGEGLKGRVRVQFIDEHGEPEAGVVSAWVFLGAPHACMGVPRCTTRLHVFAPGRVASTGCQEPGLQATCST